MPTRQTDSDETDRSLCEIGEGGRSQVSDFMDDEIIGFGIQVGATGPKSFTLDYTFDGRRRRLFIGDFPDWSTAAAH